MEKEFKIMILLKKLFFRISTLTFLLIIVFGGFVSCKKRAFIKTEGLVWNTLYHITFEGEASLQDSIMPLLEKVGASLSVFDENSLVSKVNASDTTEVDEMFMTVYRGALKMNRISNGLFDPTVSPLIEAWGFEKKNPVFPDSLKIDSLLSFVGISKTALHGKILIKEDRRTRFNFSAIAKGFGCDAVAQMFRRNGVENFMIEIGGEISVGGKSPSDKKWRISIDSPFNDTTGYSHTAFSIIEVTDCGIATSGNYRNYRDTEEGRVGHTISPITGKPVQNEIISTTIIAPDAMMADATATACMASTLEDAKEIISKTGYQAFFILPDSVWSSPGFPFAESPK